MSFKSLAQRRKFLELVKLGKLTQSKFDEWEKATGKTKLPEKIVRVTKPYKERRSK